MPVETRKKKSLTLPTQLIKMLGSPKPSKYKLAAISPKQGEEVVKKVNEHNPNIELSSKGFVERSPDAIGKRRLVGDNNGTPYVEELRTSRMTLFRADSPTEKMLFTDFSPGKKKQVEQEYPGVYNKATEFSFVVDKQTIKKGCSKRTRTQKSAMGGSAKHILELLGAEIPEEKNGGKHYQSQLLHRWGHGLGGDEVSVNLDIGSRAANIQQLSDIEDPLWRLIKKQKVDSAEVKGTVSTDSVTELPRSIHYEVTLEPGNKMFAKDIYLYSYRYPPIEQNIIVNVLLEEYMDENALTDKEDEVDDLIPAQMF